MHAYWTGAKFASLVAKECIPALGLGLLIAVPFKLFEMDPYKKRIENFYAKYDGK